MLVSGFPVRGYLSAATPMLVELCTSVYAFCMVLATSFVKFRPPYRIAGKLFSPAMTLKWFPHTWLLHNPERKGKLRTVYHISKTTVSENKISNEFY